MARTVLVALAAVTASLAAGCVGDDGATGPPAPETTIAEDRQRADADGTPSIVVIGDSVAAGEGLAYGYRYEYDADSPDSSGWTGGSPDPRWQGQYQLCHQDERAYGDLVASALGADLAKFACTGATYLDGIVALQDDGGEQLRPAQFGDWATRTQLNADYDEASPDVVVLTFGADDVDFVGIMEFCVAGFDLSESATVDAIAVAEDVGRAVDDALGSRLEDLAAELARGDTRRRDDAAESYCTAENPGAPVERLFWEPVRSGRIADHYRDLVAAIRARGEDPAHGDGKVPEIVFTTYHRPLPDGLDGDCWDVWPLSAAEQSYLDSLQATLQTTLTDAVADLEGVSVVDLSGALDGHRWCSEDPWAYGLSVYWTDRALSSQAPFHPTPEGQAAIARLVEPAVRAALADRGRS